MLDAAWALGVCAIIACIVWYERRRDQRESDALASVQWHEGTGDWEVTYAGVKWYVKREPLGELGTARAAPCGHQAGLGFTLKLHALIERARDKTDRAEWRERHGIRLPGDRSPS